MSVRRAARIAAGRSRAWDDVVILRDPARPARPAPGGSPAMDRRGLRRFPSHDRVVTFVRLAGVVAG